MNWRTITILLILANLYYWGWNAWISQPEIAGLEDHRIEKVPQLDLVSPQELEKQRIKNLNSSLATNVDDIDTDLVTSAVSTSLETGSQRLVCKRIGSFDKEDDAIAAEEWFIDKKLKTERKVGQEKVWLGHWVYLPKYPTRDAAVKVAEALREKGVKDLFIEIVTPYKNSISLGLFKQRGGAEKRSKQIQELGYQTRIGAKESDRQVFWVDVEVETNREIPIDLLIPASDQVQRIKIRECP